MSEVKVATKKRFFAKDVWKKPNNDEYTIIVGCGRLGSSLANKLSDANENVLVIDRDNRSFRKLSSAYGGMTYFGDATNPSILKEINIDKATRVIATTEFDNVNIYVGQLAKVMFNVKSVIIRVIDNDRKAIYEHLGIKSICPSELSTDAIDMIINSEEDEHE